MKSLPQATVVGDYSKALIAGFLDAGGDLSILAKKTGFSREALSRPSATLSVELYLRLLYEGGRILNDAHFGLRVGQYLHAQSLSVLGDALLKTNTIDAALQQVLALELQVHQLGVSQVVNEGDAVRLIWHCHYQQHPYVQPLVESIMAGIVSFSQKLAKRSLPIYELNFMHEKPISRLNYLGLQDVSQLLGQSCFSQVNNSLLVSKDVLAWPVRWRHPFNGVHSDTCVISHGAIKLASAVGEYLEQQLPRGNPSIGEVAGAFNLAVRTLQRRLSAEGYRYKDVLTQVRLRMANDYLRYSNLDVMEISQILGFGEQSSFNHFFIAHKTMPPLKYRQFARTQIF